MNEHEKARAWRESAGYTRPQLANLTGYSIAAIQNYEVGYNRASKRPIASRDMRTYRLACAAVAHRLLAFNWS